MQLAAHPARKIPGFALTYRPPTSVSLLWALGDAATAAEVATGVATLAGVGRPLIEAFSSRRMAIVEHLTVRGEASATAAQVATLATRQAEGERLAEAELRTRWRDQAARRGLDAGWANSLLGRTRPQRPDLPGIAETTAAAIFDDR